MHRQILRRRSACLQTCHWEPPENYETGKAARQNRLNAQPQPVIIALKNAELSAMTGVSGAAVAGGFEAVVEVIAIRPGAVACKVAVGVRGDRGACGGGVLVQAVGGVA